MREKGKLPCLDFFPHVKLVKKKDIHIHNEKVFQVHVFNYPRRKLFDMRQKKFFLDVLIFYEEIIFIEITFFW